MTKSAALIAATIDGLCKADISRAFALVDELGCVLNEQDWTFAAPEASPRGGEVTAKDFIFLNEL